MGKHTSHYQVPLFLGASKRQPLGCGLNMIAKNKKIQHSPLICLKKWYKIIQQMAEFDNDSRLYPTQNKEKQKDKVHLNKIRRQLNSQIPVIVWMSVSLQSSFSNLISNAVVEWGRTFKWWWDHKSSSLWMGLAPWTGLDRTSQTFLAFSPCVGTASKYHLESTAWALTGRQICPCLQTSQPPELWETSLYCLQITQC